MGGWVSLKTSPYVAEKRREDTYFILSLGITKGLNCCEEWFPLHETLFFSTVVL
jgi:hypothetical protein